MARRFGKGAYPKGSKVASSRTVVVPTTIVKLPKTRYAVKHGKA